MVRKVIYQLKISLKGIKPPIWRRILVPSKATFQELHDIIQEAMDWEDYHLHMFSVIDRHSPFRDFIFIGDNEQCLDYDTEEYDLDESQVILADFFTKEGQRCTYTYDFGDDWEHEILLEKIVKPEKGQLYPVCLKAMRQAPEEDSRGDWLDGTPDYVENIPTKQLTEEVNERLASLAKPYEEFTIFSPIWKELLTAIDEYKRLKPWEVIGSDEVIAIELPHYQDFAYCSVLGQLGEEFGLAVYLGDEGLFSLQKILSDKTDEEFLYEQRCLHLSLSDRNELTDADYELLIENGFRYRGKKQWPMLRSFIPGYFPWFLEEPEAEILTDVLEQLCDVLARVRDGELVITQHSDQFFARVFEDAQWVDHTLFIKRNKKTEASVIPFSVFNDDLLRSLKDNNGIGASLEIHWFTLPSPVQERENERPYFPKVLVMLDAKSGIVFAHELLNPIECQQPQIVQTVVLNMLQQAQVNPKEVFIKHEELYRILSPLFKKLTTPIKKVVNLPQIKLFQSSMLD